MKRVDYKVLPKKNGVHRAKIGVGWNKYMPLTEGKKLSKRREKELKRKKEKKNTFMEGDLPTLE